MQPRIMDDNVTHPEIAKDVHFPRLARIWQLHNLPTVK